ncbi:hypothetical protein MB46_05775 [Arthrobacter alpinus]|nr:hypothetical protein MB46_05775 [Arthrobacter alpinus]
MVLSIVLKVRGLSISTFILFVRDPVFYEETRVGNQHILAAIAALPTAAARIAGGLVDRGYRRIRKLRSLSDEGALLNVAPMRPLFPV